MKEKYTKEVIETFFYKSLAFLEVAILSSKSENTPMYNTSEYSNVTGYLVHHSTELFLKFAIFAHTKELPTHEHNIFKLHKKYSSFYGEKEFKLTIPFVEKIDYPGFDKKTLSEHKKKYPMSRELQLRYPMGRDGEIYAPITIFETDFIEKYREDLLNLKCKIMDF